MKASSNRAVNCNTSETTMIKPTKTRPYSDTRLAKYLTIRILELRPKKSQIEIATEAGFINQNMLAMLKNGSNKLPLDRVPALAKALDCDPAYLCRMALEQLFDTSERVIDDIFGALVTRNEVAWLEEIRAASGDADPTLTTKSRTAIRGVFGK